MRIGIVRIGKERDEAAFGKELAALVDAGYQVAAGTGDMLIVRVGDPAGADAGETAQAVTLAVRAKLAGKPMVVTGLTTEEIRSIAATLNGDENIRLTQNGGAAEIMSLDLRGRLTGKHAEPAAATEREKAFASAVSKSVASVRGAGSAPETPAAEIRTDTDELIAKALEGKSAGDRLGIANAQRTLGLGFPKAAKLFDIMKERGLISFEDGGYIVCGEQTETAEADEADAELVGVPEEDSAAKNEEAPEDYLDDITEDDGIDDGKEVELFSAEDLDDEGDEPEEDEEDADDDESDDDEDERDDDESDDDEDEDDESDDDDEDDEEESEEDEEE